MTRRERKENRIARRLEWAAGRRDKAESLEARNAPFRGDIAFNTQPGHIPERARAIARTEKAWEHSKMAARHEQVADGIAAQLERTIFSDDVDALERLRARIAELEASRDRCKAANREIKKGPGWGARLTDAGITLTPAELGDLASVARHQPYYADKKTGLPVFPAYHFTNLGGNIRRLKGRLAELEAKGGDQS